MEGSSGPLESHEPDFLIKNTLQYRGCVLLFIS